MIKVLTHTQKNLDEKYAKFAIPTKTRSGITKLEVLLQSKHIGDLIKTGQVRWGQVKLGEARLDLQSLGFVLFYFSRFGYFRLDQTWLGQVRLGQVRLGVVSLGQVLLAQIRLDLLVLFCQDMFCFFSLGQTWQNRLGKVKLGIVLQWMGLKYWLCCKTCLSNLDLLSIIWSYEI